MQQTHCKQIFRPFLTYINSTVKKECKLTQCIVKPGHITQPKQLKTTDSQRLVIFFSKGVSTCEVTMTSLKSRGLMVPVLVLYKTEFPAVTVTQFLSLQNAQLK